MHRPVILSIVAVGTVVGASVAVAGGSDDPASASSIIRANSQTIAADEVDTGNPGPSAGDLFVFRNRLTRGGNAFGSVEVACMFIKKEEDHACHGTATVPGGRLALSGPLSLDRPTNVVPIVGGTGRYRNAGGTVTARQTGENTSVLTFNVSSPR